MLYGVYSMRDVKTGFLTPTIELSDAAAARNFTHTVCNSEGLLNTFAQDFSLYKIGEFETDTGVLTPIRPSVLVIEGSTAVGYNGGAVHAG